MPDYANAQHASLPELIEPERFMVSNRTEIRNLLLCLARRPDIITAYFNDGHQYMLTAVLGVIDERGLLVLDVGPDDATTQQAIASGRLLCTTKHDGVLIRFSCENLQSARFQAQQAIATPIPDSVYRLQRREFFRVVTPKLNGPRCTFPKQRGDTSCTLTVIDLSVGGLGMLDPESRLSAGEQERIENCRLYLPELGEIGVTVVIRNKGLFTPHNGEPQTRIGASFEGLSISDNATLQRYIFHLQTLQPK